MPQSAAPYARVDRTGLTHACQARLVTRIIAAVVIAAALFATPGPSFCQSATPPAPRLEGWGKSRWGMSAADIERHYAAEVRAVTPVDRYDFKRTTGERYFSPLGIDEVRIGGVVAQVRFLFIEDRSADGLALVLLSSKATAPVTLQQEFSQIAQLLTEKYGPQTRTDESSNPRIGSRQRTSTWVLDGTVIVLEFMQGSGYCDLSIVYRPQVAAPTL